MLQSARDAAYVSRFARMPYLKCKIKKQQFGIPMLAWNAAPVQKIARSKQFISNRVSVVPRQSFRYGSENQNRHAAVPGPPAAVKLQLSEH
jgi:hypothetical protein